jgi:hypothetical protein
MRPFLRKQYEEPGYAQKNPYWYGWQKSFIYTYFEFISNSYFFQTLLILNRSKEIACTGIFCPGYLFVTALFKNGGS